MKIWTDRAGKPVEVKEFFSRWKQGIEGITPLQQTKAIVNGTWISLLGIVLGIIVSLFQLKNFWWIVIILIGAFIVSGMGQIGNLQKYYALKKFEQEVNNEQ